MQLYNLDRYITVQDLNPFTNYSPNQTLVATGVAEIQRVTYLRRTNNVRPTSH
jgi:hypothetical protein